MFDTNNTITIGGMRTAAGKIDITVRWPTDEEWAAWRKRCKLVMRPLGRGSTEMDSDTSTADSKLYEVVRLNGAPPLTIGESSFVVKTVARCDVVKVELGADEAEVDLQILTGRARHTVRIPTMDEVRKLQKTTHWIQMAYGVQEVRTSLEAAAALWDACGGKTEGYAGAVPNLHKDIVIRAVIKEIEDEAAPQTDEDSF